MRRLISLMVVTIVCWGLAMACSGGSGVPQSPAQKPVAPNVGDAPLVPGAGGGGTIGGGTVDVPVIPIPAMAVTIDAKPVVQYGVYAATEVKAHASDAKGQATTFHWSLVGPGINGGLFADGADATFKLPPVTDKTAYELTLIGSLSGNAVPQTINFFTIPAPTADIKANVNQAPGAPVWLNPNGALLKGKKIQFSAADSKFANQYKWQVLKLLPGEKAKELGTTESAVFEATEVGKFQAALQVWGDGGFSPMVFFNFSVDDNAVAINVKSTVTKDAFVKEFIDGGQYPVGATLTMDASGILPAEGLESSSCVLKDPKGVEKVFSSKVDLLAVGNNTVTCTYKLKAGYAEAAGSVLSSSVSFDVLPKAKAMILVDNQNCDLATPQLFQVGKTVQLSALNSTGNINSYSWINDAGTLIGPNMLMGVKLSLDNPVPHTITLNAKGTGDSDSVICIIYAKPLPSAVIAADSTIKTGHSYIYGGHQNAHATVKSGSVTDFDWSLLSDAGTVLNSSTTQKAADLFEFLLSEVGTLTVNLTSKFVSLVGPANSVNFASKKGQVSLVTPDDFSNIQSIATVNSSDIYFASPSAIFHKGMDGRVVQVKNIATIGDTHPALPDGFFARNSGDVYLLTTDGGYWRYTFKDGWVYSSKGAGPNQQGIAGPSSGTRLFVTANSRLFAGDVALGTWTKIGDGQRYVTVQGSYAYAVASLSVAGGAGSDPAVVQCTTVKCTPLSWNVDPNGVVVWKSIGASASTVYLSDANSRIYTLQNNFVTVLGSLKNDDWIVSFAARGTMTYAIGNKGGVYKLDATGVTPLFVSPATITHAAGVVPEFWAWDDAKKRVIFVKDANPVVMSTQPALGANAPACAPQKMWMDGDTAYVATCTQGPGALLYNVWTMSYSGDMVLHKALISSTPIVGLSSDGAGGVLAMQNGGANNTRVVQLKAGAIQVDVLVDQNKLNPGEFFTGMSGKFFITNQGIRVNDGQAYPLVQADADAHHPFAVGDVLYFSHNNDVRLAKFDLSQSKMDDIANVSPTDPKDPGPIVDVTVDSLNRVYVLTAKSLYRYDGNTKLAEVYNTLGNVSLLNAMAIMNGHQALLSYGSKGLALIDMDGKVAPLSISPDVEMGLPTEVWSVGYNGTEFLFYGRDLQTNALFLHQFGAPQ